MKFECSCILLWVVWSEWHKRKTHGYIILVFVGKVWFVASSNFICRGCGTSLITMATTLHSIIDCEPLKDLKVILGYMFGHWCLMPISMLQIMTKILLGWKNLS
jgi:hypothetical protein